MNKNMEVLEEKELEKISGGEAANDPVKTVDAYKGFSVGDFISNGSKYGKIKTIIVRPSGIVYFIAIEYKLGAPTGHELKFSFSSVRKVGELGS